MSGIVFDRNRVGILVARFALSACQALGAVVIPIYLSVIGFSALELGVLFFAVVAASAVISAVVGIASDRIGRKPFLVAVPLVVVVAASIMAWTKNPVVLFVVIPLSSFGRGYGAGAGTVGFYQPAEAAYIADQVPAKYRNSAFARLTFASSIGSVVGNGLVGVIAVHHLTSRAALSSERPLFILAAGLGLMASVSVMFVHEKREPLPRAARGSVRLFPVRSILILRRLFVSNGITGMAIGLYAPFISYWFFKSFEVGPGKIGLLFAIANVTAGCCALVASKLARRFGSVWSVFWLRLLQSVVFAAMVLSHIFVVAGGLYVVYVVGQRVGIALRQSYMAAMADPSERGAVVALSNLPAEVTQAAMSPLTGFLLESVGFAAPFLMSAIFQFINGVIYLKMFIGHRPEEELAERQKALANPESDSSVAELGGVTP